MNRLSGTGRRLQSLALTCFLSTMWILRELGLEKTRTFKAVLAGFVLSFFTTRSRIYPLWCGVGGTTQTSKRVRPRAVPSRGAFVLNLWWFERL